MIKSVTRALVPWIAVLGFVAVMGLVGWIEAQP